MCTNSHNSDQDGISRYVAEENIDPQHNPPFYDEYHNLETGESGYRLLGQSLPEEPSCNSSFLQQQAGRYFLRWDFDEHKFVSNIKKWYPED